MLFRSVSQSRYSLSGWFGFGYNNGDVNQNNKVVLNYKFFKVNPSVLDPILVLLLILLGILTNYWLTLISVVMLPVICHVMVYLINFF